MSELIKLIKKHWGLLIDSLIVIGVILAFTFWDPFGIFTKTKLRETANMVSSIRDIGQLVAAEYYGEVISSWKEFKLTEIPQDTISSKARQLYVDLKNGLHEKKLGMGVDNWIDESGIKKEYDEFYQSFIAFLAAESSNSNDIEKFYHIRKNKLKDRVETDVLRSLRKEVTRKNRQLEDLHGSGTPEYEETLDIYLSYSPDFLSGFYSFYNQIINQKLSRGKNKRKSIVFIGRGWVKAGFDFGAITKQNLLFDKSHKTIHLYGLQPVILDHDINPWFIPERKVKGYELVDYSGAVTFEDAKDVKALCKQKLLLQAQEADILNRALENGTEALTSFFSLLLEEPDLEVKFHNRPYSNQFALISADTLITLSEAIYIDTFISNELERISMLEAPLDTLQKIQMGYFIGQLKSLPFLDPHHLFSRYSLLAAHVLKDSFHVSMNDVDSLIGVRQHLVADKSDGKRITSPFVETNKIWFSYGNTRYNINGRDFRNEFNDMIDQLGSHAVSIEFMDTISKSLVLNYSDTIVDGKIYDKLELKQSSVENDHPQTEIICVFLDQLNSKYGETVLSYFPREEILSDIRILNDLKYSVIDHTETEDSLVNRFNRDDTLFTKEMHPMVYNPEMEQLTRNENEIIYKALTEKLLYEERKRPLDRLISSSNSILNRMKQ